MSVTKERAEGALDVARIRADFPILSRMVGDKPMVFLDSAATSQKPRQVIEAEREFYERHNANVHRGIYMLSEEATELYEGAREKLARFIGASEDRKSTRLNSSHTVISYAVFCLKKKKKKRNK